MLHNNNIFKKTEALQYFKVGKTTISVFELAKIQIW